MGKSNKNDRAKRREKRKKSRGFPTLFDFLLKIGFLIWFYKNQLFLIITAFILGFQLGYKDSSNSQADLFQRREQVLQESLKRKENNLRKNQQEAEELLKKLKDDFESQAENFKSQLTNKNEVEKLLTKKQLETKKEISTLLSQLEEERKKNREQKKFFEENQMENQLAFQEKEFQYQIEITTLQHLNSNLEDRIKELEKSLIEKTNQLNDLTQKFSELNDQIKLVIEKINNKQAKDQLQTILFFLERLTRSIR